jgi:hypothetical protein
MYSLASSTSVAVVPKRANAIMAQLHAHATAAASPAAGEKKSDGDKKQTLTVIDNRTGKTIDLPIQHNTIVATKFLDFGLKYVDTPDSSSGERRIQIHVLAAAARRCSARHVK